MSVVGSVEASVGRKVLVASADAEVRSRVRQGLTRLRWQVREASGGAEALAQLEEVPVAAVLLDSWLPDLEVGELAAMLRRLYPATEVLALRAEGAGALGGGATVPGNLELRHVLRRLLEPAQGEATVLAGAVPARQAPVEEVRRERVVAREPALAVELIDGLVGRAPVMVELASLIRKVAPTLATVLIEGETGTGKEVVAQALHRLSLRAGKPMVVLNCAAIPEALLEAELFGHARGAFTGADRARTGRIEAAHGGTLFLDEIGEMPLGLQAKMLRFLEAHELQRVGENEVLRVNVRVLAATHQDLETKVAEGGFRLDLYHRLAVFPLQVPALRERREDIPLLAEHLLAQMGRTAPRKQLSAEALDALLAHSWPGNVRELAHVLERAAILAGDETVLRAAHIRLRRADRR
jgi:DNA-binding NtrC family response regulator